MNQSSKNCIFCSVPGQADVWNGLKVLACPACTLTWRDSFDLPVDYYNTVEVDVEDRKKNYRELNTNDQIQSLKKYLPQTDICDLGAGDGTFLLSLGKSGYKNCFGLEPGENGLKVARERGLDIKKGVIADLPVLSSERKISAVTMFHLIEHLSDPISSLKTIRDRLSQDGVLVIETPDSDAPIQRITDHKNHLVYHEHLFYWNKKSLQKLLEETGFELMAVHRRSFNWRSTSIRNSLLRLGLIKKINLPKQKASGEEPPHQKETSIKESRRSKKPFRSIIRSVLAYIVHWLGRDDYIVVIAKPIKK